MTVKEFQKRVTEFFLRWDKKRNVVSTEQMAFNHLVEEVGELAMQFVNKEQRPWDYKEEEIEDAIGDILIQTIRLTYLKGLDIEDIILKIMKNEEDQLKGI